MAKKTKIKASDFFDAPKTAQELKLEDVQNLYNFLFECSSTGNQCKLTNTY